MSCSRLTALCWSDLWAVAPASAENRLRCHQRAVVADALVDAAATLSGST
jgi:hypothetical protein